MVLVLLTALLGFADWFPAPGWSRPMMLGLIATVGIYGYFREKADQKKTLLAFANVARYRFAEEAKRIHAERDREIEAGNRDVEAGKREALEGKRSEESEDEAFSVNRLIDNEGNL